MGQFLSHPASPGQAGPPGQAGQAGQAGSPGQAGKGHPPPPIPPPKTTTPPPDPPAPPPTDPKPTTPTTSILDPTSTENPEPPLSTDPVLPPASTENTSTGTTTAEAQSSLVNGDGSSDGSQVSGTQIEPVSSTDSIFRTGDGNADHTLTTPFSVPFGTSSSLSPVPSGVYVPKGGLTAKGASTPFPTSIDGGAAASPHNPAAIVLGVLVPVFALLLAVAGYIGYKRHRRLRDRQAWERTHAEIAGAVRDARPSVQPWVRFPDSPAPDSGAFERGEETPALAPAPERDSVYGGIEKESSSFDGTSLYAAHDRQQ